MPAPVLNTFWMGTTLGAVERACLRSALRHGHDVRLWCYSEPRGVPEGVEVADAADVVPEERVILHERGSPSLFSNLFRYVLQQRELGTWIDADVYLLKPIDFERPSLIGWESETMLNGAVLRLPPESPLLGPLVELFEERTVPFWLPWSQRWEARLRLLRTGRTGLPQMPWGVTGPKALTALSRRHGLAGEALPRTVFYPVPYQRADWVRDPRARVEDVSAEDTVAIHLWNDVIRPWKDEPAAPGSFLARLQQEGR